MVFYEIESRLNSTRLVRIQLLLSINKYRECLKQREQDLKELDLRIEELEFSLKSIKGEMKE